MKPPVCIHWFRRDLRLEDNAALSHALRHGLPVLPLFIFDKDILGKLPDKDDRRVTFIHGALQRINEKLAASGASIKVLHDTPLAAFERLTRDYDVRAVYTNSDYEPYATVRDDAVEAFCRRRGIAFNAYKDQVVFEKEEVVKADGQPYTVFTPYANQWKRRYREHPAAPFDTGSLRQNFFAAREPLPSLASLGFRENGSGLPEADVTDATLASYHETRNFPALDKTTRAGLHLRFGTLSVRRLAARAARLNEKYLDELIWREFFMQILWHFPHVTERPFKKKYENLRWRHDEDGFRAWCRGETGYPLVDAGMRELNETGFMHNRVRMVAANFLTRLLLVDWRWGEAWFAQKLGDFELASNNGNWQWAAGCGCDAAPYFRIFNPALQAAKFDPDGAYVRRWIPGFDPDDYLPPIVDFNRARQQALGAYKEALTTA